MSCSRGTAGLQVFTWSDACTTCEAAGNVGDKVTIQVRRDQHIKLLGMAHELHACIFGRDRSRQGMQTRTGICNFSALWVWQAVQCRLA